MEKRNMKRNNKKSQVVKAAKVYVKASDNKWMGEIEYKMPVDLYNDLLKESKKFHKDAHEYVCNYVNELEGLAGSCVRVIPF